MNFLKQFKSELPQRVRHRSSNSISSGNSRLQLRLKSFTVKVYVEKGLFFCPANSSSQIKINGQNLNRLRLILDYVICVIDLVEMSFASHVLMVISTFC